MPNPAVHIDLRVQSLVRDLDTLQLPEHDDAMLRENLQEIIEINGTTDPAEQRFKRLLLTQTGMAISLHKRQVQHTNDCIVSRLVVRDEAGNPVKMPWDDAIENLKTSIEKRPEIEDKKPEEPTEEVALGGKFFQLVTFRGKHVSRIVTVAISVLIVVSGIIITVKLSKDQLSSMMQSAITEAVRREAQAKATNNTVSEKQ